MVVKGTPGVKATVVRDRQTVMIWSISEVANYPLWLLCTWWVFCLAQYSNMAVIQEIRHLFQCDNTWKRDWVMKVMDCLQRLLGGGSIAERPVIFQSD